MSEKIQIIHTANEKLNEAIAFFEPLCRTGEADESEAALIAEAAENAYREFNSLPKDRYYRKGSAQGAVLSLYMRFKAALSNYESANRNRLRIDGQGKKTVKARQAE